MAAPAEFGSEGSASEFGSVYWFKKVMGSNIARGLDNGLLRGGKAKLLCQKRAGIQTSKVVARAVTNMASRGGGMGVHIAGGRAGTASQGTKVRGDRAPHVSVCPAEIALRVARPSSPRAQSSPLCPVNLPLDGGTRGLL